MGKREAHVEDYLRDQVKAHGGFYRKVNYQGRKGAPDDWNFFPEGRLLIVECKAPGEKPEPLQLEEMRKLREQGFYVAWVDSREAVDRVLKIFIIGFKRAYFDSEFPL